MADNIPRWVRSEGSISGDFCPFWTKLGWVVFVMSLRTLSYGMPDVAESAAAGTPFSSFLWTRSDEAVTDGLEVKGSSSSSSDVC